MSYIVTEEMPVTHDFLKKHINFVLSEPEIYKEFYEEFQRYFLKNILSAKPFENFLLIQEGSKLEEKELNYLKNNLRRIFLNEQHFKGVVGEHLFSFYYFKMVEDLLWTHGPKGRSSAEPGIDFITFTGNENVKETIKITVWETKTTEKSVTTRASEIYDFFSENGSFEENIDSEITAIQDLFENTVDSCLKEVVGDLYNIVINRDKRFCIGASGISPLNNSTEATFKKFAECFSGEISKEQRLVKFLFIELLNNVLNDLRENIWNKLQTL
ncbi:MULTISPECIES: hypothetical protein [Bacillus]|uniref:hypothetical protein n=1 Tax=Bacillus TaxID=1386 RepID=UPI000BFCD1FB|nr:MULTISPECIES: hypothetical protein [Bacillus cereus group]MDF9495171.1 hypothetical protein [Bacillus cereus]NIE93054.1 hypothetical protein [Bacillus sp. Ab-1751]PGQ49755.1 hypothetical protein COA20_05385 [Bacillus thuringiensis]